MIDLRRIHFKAKPFFLILFGMFIYAVFVLVLRAIAGDLSWITLTFWLCLGWTMLPLLICTLSPSICRAMYHKIVETRGKIFGYTASQEIADVGANAARAAALGFAAVPAAVTDLVGGLQVIFALIFGFFAARLLPSVYTFTLTRREILYKISCFAVMMVGLALVVGV
jgi:hypothetical protein